MFSNTQLRSFYNPLAIGYEKQELIRKAKALVEGLEVEYNQIIEYCKEVKLDEQGEYSISITRSIEREIVPTRFAEEFPEANLQLVKKQIAFLESEARNLKETNILKVIRIKDAKKEITKLGVLEKACILAITEKRSIVKLTDSDDDRK